MDDLNDHDESVRIAVRALGDMRNSTPHFNSATPALSSASSSSSSPPPSTAPDLADQPDFVYRVSNFPLVGTALRAYETGKNSSRVLKYGAEMMESSVKTISGPVIDRLPVNVSTLDEFACRQLDRLSAYRRPSSSELEKPQDLLSPDFRSRSSTVSSSSTSDLSYRGASTSNSSPSRSRRSATEVPTWLETTSPFIAPPPPPPESTNSRTPTPTTQYPQSIKSESENDPSNQQIAPAPSTSRWQTVLLEAGGLSAALSEESMRRLRYCLQWLQYATAHIDAQILILRDFIQSLQPSPQSLSAADSQSLTLSPTHLRTLSEIRHDLIHTIRQVVDVVSKYTGGALPEPARSRVRGFILVLPRRWAQKAGVGTDSIGTGSGGGKARSSRYSHRRGISDASSSATSSAGGVDRSRTNSPTTSRPSSPLLPRASLHPHSAHNPYPASHVSSVTSGSAMQADTATHAAQKILTLATESLDMMRGVTGVVKESLERAEGWVGRLRAVGLQRSGGDALGEETLRDFGALNFGGTGRREFEGSGPGTPTSERDSAWSDVGSSAVPASGISITEAGSVLGGTGKMTLKGMADDRGPDIEVEEINHRESMNEEQESKMDIDS